jgi:hypothetical protein
MKCGRGGVSNRREGRLPGADAAGETWGMSVTLTRSYSYGWKGEERGRKVARLPARRIMYDRVQRNSYFLLRVFMR